MAPNVRVSRSCPSRPCHRSDAHSSSRARPHPKKGRHSLGCQPRTGVRAIPASLGHSLCSTPKHDVPLELQQNFRGFSLFWDKCPSPTSLGMHVGTASTASSWDLPARASPEGLGQGSHPGTQPHLTVSSRPFQDLFLQDKMSTSWHRADV